MHERVRGMIYGSMWLAVVLGAGPAAAVVMDTPEVTVLAADADRTVVQIRFSPATAPDDWNRPGELSWSGLDAFLPGDDGEMRRQAPEFSRLVAVRDRLTPIWRVRSVQWYREPTDPAAAPVTVSAPGLYRGVPLAGLAVRPEAGGGILAVRGGGDRPSGRPPGQGPAR